MKLGELIRSTRAERGLSQQRLAELSGISIATISRIEAGESEGNAATVSRLVNVLEIDPRLAYGVLVGGEAGQQERQEAESPYVKMLIDEMEGLGDEDRRFLLHMARALKERVGGVKRETPKRKYRRNTRDAQSSRDVDIAGVWALAAAPVPAGAA